MLISSELVFLIKSDNIENWVQETWTWAFDSLTKYPSN